MSLNSQTFAIEQRLIDKLQIKEMVFVLVFSVLLQLLIHLIPSGNVPLGAQLLPLFYAPFIAVLFFRLHVGLAVALLSPLCNYLITGNPASGILGIISIELVFFVLLTKLFSKNKIIKYINAPVSFVLAMVFSSFAILLMPFLYTKGNSWTYFSNSIQNSVAGIMVLFIINFAAIKLYQKIRK
jgi:hypothetical protein